MLLATFLQNTETVNTISQFFLNIFGGLRWLVVTVMSMIPIIEIKGSIPLGIGWGMHKFSAVFFGVLGCTIITIFLIFALKPIMNWLKKTKVFQKLIARFEKSFMQKAQKLEEASGITEKTTHTKRTIIFMLLLTLFIAIPIPLSGVWTGCAIGIFIGLKRWQVFVSSFLGSVISAILVAFIASLFGEWTNILFYCMLGLAGIVFIVLVTKISLDIAKERKAEKLANTPPEKDGEK